MRAWADALRDASSQCKDVPAGDVGPTRGGASATRRGPLGRAVALCTRARACGSCDAETDDMDQDSAQALFSSAVDKNGQPITRRMMDRPVTP